MARFAFPLAIVCTSAVTALPAAVAGPYIETGHAPSAMVGWASEIDEIDRGPMDAADPLGGDASFGDPENALGSTAGNDVYDVVSLGDGGFASMFFELGISNGQGDDFAVFENGFYTDEGLFAELAFVEVSSNGIDFARFPAVSLTPGPVGSVGLQGVIDPTDVHNLAGRQPLGLGTGFDLSEISADALVIAQIVDLEDIRYVRVVDVVGDGSTVDARVPPSPVYDPYPTDFAAGGFDLQAIGVMHLPEPDSRAMLPAGAALLLRLAKRRARLARAVRHSSPGA